MSQKPKLDYRSVVVITGPSGVGKGTLIRELKSKIPGLAFSVSATTRKPRPGEQEGVDYHFLTPDEFAKEVAADGFVEYAEYSGNYYGTLRSEIDRHLASGAPVILEIELQGARQIREQLPEVLSIFIAPPSFDALKSRLVGRGTDSAEQIAKRLETAKVELGARDEFDVQVVNDRLDDAIEELAGVVEKRIRDTSGEQTAD